MNDTAFSSRCTTIGNLINNRHWESAYREARALVRDAPSRAQAYFLLNLVTCLTGQGGGTRYSHHLIEDARHCPDFTSALEGDMVRDRAIAFIREGDKGLIIARGLISDIRTLHAGDVNRLACLAGVEGRLAYANGQYEQAVKLHHLANSMWESIWELADRQWVYNNYVHWLRATVAAYGRRAAHARWIVRWIETRCPEGARSRQDEARLLCVPVVGRQLYDLYAKATH